MDGDEDEFRQDALAWLNAEPRTNEQIADRFLAITIEMSKLVVEEMTKYVQKFELKK